MKIIFLDIDGVLNSRSSCVAYNGYPWPDHDRHKFQQVSVDLLKKLVDDSGAKVVLSSTWRDYVDLKEFSEFLGIDIISKTRVSIGDEPRGNQIQDWLENELTLTEIESYIIIDDNFDMLEGQYDRFVQTDEETGFMYPEYKLARDLLGGFKPLTSEIINL